ncbi:MAG: ABC transporter permease, partial [Chloroflexi bacterium]|nr:ABC transporter permease [Chloroflexota bacterium]
ALRIVNDGFPVLIQNGQAAPELVAEFEQDDSMFMVEPLADPESDPFDEALVVVVVPDDFEQRIAANETASLQLLTRDTSVITYLAQGAARAVISRYTDRVLDQRLADHGLSRDWLSPIEVNEGKRAPSSSVAAANGNDEDDGPGILGTIFLPLAVTSWLVGGGMGLIVDTTVGEKEHQTVENLLVTPASRIGIVLGKLTVVFIASIAVMSLWLVEGIVLNSLSAAGPTLMDSDSLSPTETLDVFLNSGGNVFGLIGALVILIIPFIVTLNGVMMAWCARSANYREANLFMVLMQLGLPASILLTIFSLPATVGVPVYAIPFFGTIVAIRDLFSGTLPTAGLLVNVISGSVYALVGLGLAAWVFNKEWSLTRGLQ